MRRVLLALALLVPSLVHAQQIPQQPAAFVPEMQFRLPPEAIPALSLILPPLPDSVPTARGWSHVVVTDSMTVCKLPVPQGSILLGCVVYETRSVYIRRGMVRAVAWHVLEHERAHLMWHDSGQWFAPADAERLCDIVATTRLMDHLMAYAAATHR